MTCTPPFIDRLKLAAEQAACAEEDFRREIVERSRALERERAFAYRRLNFMRAMTDTIATVESEEIAIAAAMAVMRTRLGWSSDSDARTAVLSRFVPVAQQIFASLAPADEDGAPPPDPLHALTEFETWYRDAHSTPFWVLFENQMPETPLVDF